MYIVALLHPIFLSENNAYWVSASRLFPLETCYLLLFEYYISIDHEQKFIYNFTGYFLVNHI